jgi:Icc-related predicted phosphoesterase
MKILSVADLHYTLKQWDWLRSAAADYDLVVLPGDLLDIVSPVALDVQILVVRKYLRRLPETTPVLVTSGNHDGDHVAATGERSAAWLRDTLGPGLVTDGESWERDGVLFTLCPWWDGDASRDAVAALLEQDAAKPKDTWIWLYHAPPAGSRLAWDGRREFGDAAVAEWIRTYQPDVVFAGHIHQAPFAKDGVWFDRIGRTVVFNAGKQIGPVPAFIELDLGHGTATWRSLAGTETIRLRDDAR